MHFKLKIWIKDLEENKQYCTINGFIKEVIVLYNQLIFLIKITNGFKKAFKEFWKKKDYGWLKD